MATTNWKVPDGVNLSKQVMRCIGPAENLYYIKVLNTENDKERAMNLVWKQIFTSDPIISVIYFDPVSKESLRIWLRKYLNQDVAYGCFSQPEDNLVAVDLQHVRYNCHESPSRLEDCGEAFKRFKKYMNIIARNIGSKSHIINYLTSFGLYIELSHRHIDNVDIQREMIKLRHSVAKAVRIKIAASAFVGSEIQRVAQQIGYKQIMEFNYEKMKGLGLDLGCAEIFPIQIMGVENKLKEEPETRKIIRPRTRRNQSAGTHKVQSKPLIEQTVADVVED